MLIDQHDLACKAFGSAAAPVQLRILELGVWSSAGVPLWTACLGKHPLLEDGPGRLTKQFSTLFGTARPRFTPVLSGMFFTRSKATPALKGKRKWKRGAIDGVYT